MDCYTPPDQSPMKTVDPLSEDFLNSLVAALDNDEIVGIIFGGSYARKEYRSLQSWRTRRGRHGNWSSRYSLQKHCAKADQCNDNATDSGDDGRQHNLRYPSSPSLLRHSIGSFHFGNTYDDMIITSPRLSNSAFANAVAFPIPNRFSRKYACPEPAHERWCNLLAAIMQVQLEYSIPVPYLNKSSNYMIMRRRVSLHSDPISGNPETSLICEDISSVRKNSLAFRALQKRGIEKRLPSLLGKQPGMMHAYVYLAFGLSPDTTFVLQLNLLLNDLLPILIVLCPVFGKNGQTLYSANGIIGCRTAHRCESGLWIL
jgi:hypothetical protein